MLRKYILKCYEKSLLRKWVDPKKQLLDILVINETKLDDKTDSALFESINYDLIRRDRLVNKGGGILKNSSFK